MTFTEDQMNILRQWEDNFKTAIQAKWTRGIGTSGFTTMHRIYEAATGKKRPFSPSCGTCMLNLVRDTGVLYFADMDAIRKAHEVKMQQFVKETEKVVVKTRKPRTKKNAV